jgi:CheY-like chemotaxis protein
VLIVEDDPLAARLLTMLLSKRLNASVEQVDTAEKAIASIMTQSNGKPLPDLILSDLSLPGISGVNLLKLLRDRCGNNAVPIIAISGIMDARTKELCMKAGAALCFDKSELCANFDTALDQIMRVMQQSLLSKSA